jgi:plastocyanin
MIVQEDVMDAIPGSKEKSGYVRILLFLTCAVFTAGSIAAVAVDDNAQKFTLHLSDYRFHPDTIEVVAGRPVELTLVNDDKITPHNFTLKAPDAGMDLSADISAGHSTTVRFTPVSAGSYVFYCNKKLLFMKSHRARGMEGKLIVRPVS